MVVVVKNLTLSFVRSPNELGILPDSIVSYMSITWRFFIRLSSEGKDPDTRVPHSDMLLRFYRGGERDGDGDGEGDREGEGDEGIITEIQW